MAYAIVINDTPTEWNGQSWRDSQGRSHPANAPSLYSQSEREAADIYEIIETEIPDGQVSIGYTLEWDAEEETVTRIHIFTDAPPPVVPDPYLNNAGLVRFTGPSPVTVIENIRMTGVTRVSKGRYRAYHATPYPSASYAVFASVLDASPCQVRVSARTASYAEVRVIDALSAAYDPQEVSIRTERVVTP